MSIDLKPSILDAISFLKDWTRPGEFPTLSAAFVDPATGAKGAFESQSFSPGEDGAIPWGAVAGWISARQGGHLGWANLYWAVNPLLHPLAKKAERTDVKALVCLHVDADCFVNEDQAKGIERITARLKAYKVPPSLIIVSGGGAQAFWRLKPEDVIPINGDLEAAEDAKRYNQQIERDLGGDACHNIDRIMRLPGSVNVPNAIKVKKGRKPALAYVLECPGTTYPLAAFTKAAKVQEGTAAPGASPHQRVKSGNFEELDVADERLAGLSMDYKNLIVHGVQGDAGAKYNGDRSRAAFAVATEMVRKKIADDVIASVLMTKAWQIGACVRDKKNVERELNRILGRAHEAAHDEDLARMNEDHCVVCVGGKTRVMTWEEDVRGRRTPRYSSFEDFRNLYSNERKVVQVKDEESGETKTRSKPLGEWWLSNKQRRQYNGGLKYMPHVDADVGGRPGQEWLNLWTGFAYEPSPAVQPTLYLEHLREIICGGNEVYYQYLLNWMAHAVQRRGEPGQAAVCLRGDEGTGKGVAIRHFGALWGPHFLHATNPEHLTGRFNQHLQTVSVLFGDECFWAGDRRHEQILKVLVTEPTFMVEPKGVNAFQVDNFLHVLLSSNSDWIIPASSTARRWFVLSVSNARMQDGNYFGKMEAQMRAGGYAGLLHLLLNMNLAGFDVRKVPQTEELQLQKALTRRGVDALVEYVANAGQLPFAYFKSHNIALTTGTRSGEGFWPWARNEFPDLRHRAPESIGRELRDKWACERWHLGDQTGIKFPTLTALRGQFDKRHGEQKWEPMKTWRPWHGPASGGNDMAIMDAARVM